ncbi:MAG: hypothetical protein DRI80_08390 [Chloroflexota bacterium]|nr:MAG: hypothetical protein DRI80_08390 [Chloroflexota bacterium]
MSQPCFLLDENMAHRAIRKLLLRREPKVHILAVGQPDAPPLSTPDPELLIWIEEHGCLLVTKNRASMPTHLRNHLVAGRHVPGILIVPQRMAPWQISDQLYLIWIASLQDEYQDQIVYLPLR